MKRPGLILYGAVCYACLMTGYVLIGLFFEERALVRETGGAYRDYQNRIPMLVPISFKPTVKSSGPAA